MSKQCNTCNKLLDVNCFSKNLAKKDGLQAKCKECTSKYYKNYYDNSDIEKNRLYSKNKEKAELVKKLIASAKDVPCADCNVKYPSYVMDFDHLDPSTKIFTIASASRLYSIELIQAEINKCEVVCANCHRIRTHK